jgi:hypothetical protein
MIEEVVRSVTFFSLLFRFDKEMADKARQEGCPVCGGRLDRGTYTRKPRGSPVEIPEEYCARLSLCCAAEGCRSRVLPPSSLFMGRRVYWGAIILLVVVLRQGRTKGFTVRKIQKQYGVTVNTLRRWMRYFREEFAQSPEWKRLRGRVVSSIQDGDMAGLLEYFIAFRGDSTRGLVSALEFLSGGKEQV